MSNNSETVPQAPPERPALLPETVPPAPALVLPPPVDASRQQTFRYDLVAVAVALAVTCALFFMAMRAVLDVLKAQQQQLQQLQTPPLPLPTPVPAAANPPPTIVVKCDPSAVGQSVFVDYGLERDLQQRRAPLMFPQLVRGNEVEIGGGRAQYDELYPVYDDDLAIIGVDDAPTTAFAFEPSAHIHDTPMRENTDSSFVAVGGPASYDQGTINAAVDPEPASDTVAATAEGDSPAFDMFKRAAIAGESVMEVGGSIVRPKSTVPPPAAMPPAPAAPADATSLPPTAN